MAETVKVNALGDACPIPVVKTLKALKALGGPGSVETAVDNEVAVQNLQKLASDNGCAADVQKTGESEWHVTITAEKGLSSDTPEPTECPSGAPAAADENLVIAIGTDVMGQGSDELGHNLMKGFIYAVTQQDQLPRTMLFFNGGAHLTCEGSPVLDDLKSLAAQGVEIMTCGACLKFYQLEDKLAVGEPTNMYVIVEKMEKATKLIRQ